MELFQSRPLNPYLWICWILLLSAPRIMALSETPLWSHEFDSSSLDTSVWNYDIGTGSDGWGNWELETYTDSTENVHVDSNDGLTITAIPNQHGGFTSGRIHTNHKFAFQYGTLEASIKLSDLSDGLWPAFWLLGHDFDAVGWPDCGEIDVMEMGYMDSKKEGGDGRMNRIVTSASHYKQNGQYQSNTNGYLLADEPIAGDNTWHNLTLSWTPSLIETFMDDELIWHFEIGNPEKDDTEEFHKPFFLLVNLAVGGNFPDIHDPSKITAPLPATYSVEYIRLFDNGYTTIVQTNLPVAEKRTLHTVIKIMVIVMVVVVGIVLLKKVALQSKPHAVIATEKEHEMANLAGRVA